ncbi:MAG TPA: metal/formaldehyde-sensitive transcriptional repressor [Aquimonas sp.]|jgi:FrmR/RcnR family transcriptional regulator, repressor of frmRAB operon|nr:metal/formaldehyde-sensitive transcriptional repressor [Xanthomonadales bacterium]HRD72385.1 metal/formaldehyde-sensitive transcriptional repressor [Aquimonas sp.]HRF53511.1 metal/formaldehyde-sensitive transcriptional repressor [Aquimonas sp.]
MPHSPAELKRVLTRVRRIRGQTEALERSLEQQVACGSVLQQIAAIRGAVNGLMAQVLESHLRESFGHPPQKGQATEHASPQQALDEVVSLLRSYMT